MCLTDPRQYTPAGKVDATAPVPQLCTAFGRCLFNDRRIQHGGWPAQFGRKGPTVAFDTAEFAARDEQWLVFGIGPVDGHDTQPRPVPAAGKQIGIGDQAAGECPGQFDRPGIKTVPPLDGRWHHARGRPIEEAIEAQIAIMAGKAQHHAIAAVQPPAEREAGEVGLEPVGHASVLPDLDEWHGWNLARQPLACIDGQAVLGEADRDVEQEACGDLRPGRRRRCKVDHASRSQSPA